MTTDAGRDAPASGVAGAEPDDVLVLTGISKRFGGNAALDDVDFSVRRGEVHALLGGNGSGKSTMIKTMAGVYQADAGTIRVGAEHTSARHVNPVWSYDVGLRFVHQDTGVFLDHTVAENFALGSTYGHRFLSKINWRQLNRRVRTTLERFDLDIDPRVRMGRLRKSEQTLVAVARALDDRAESSVLVLDEPTASLPQHEVDQVHEAIRGFVQRGLTVVLVSHRVDDIKAVADRATFLRDGTVAGTRSVTGLDERVIVAEMAGAAEVIETHPRHWVPPTDDSAVLRIRNLAGGGAHDISFDLRAGEILGLAGLAGSGRSSILRAVAGLLPRKAGTLELNGSTLEPSMRPDEAIAKGIVYVPENRGADAAFPERTVRDNFTMPRVRSFWRGWRLSGDLEREAAGEAIARYDVKPPRPDAVFNRLSGGNQQKVIMARWLEMKPSVVLLDEPTQGVDVGARSALHAHVRRAADSGVAVIVASSDPRELAELSDRVLGVVDGTIRSELTGASITSRACIQAAYGVDTDTDAATARSFDPTDSSPDSPDEQDTSR